MDRSIGLASARHWVAVAAVVVPTLFVDRASAQCGATHSTCSTCHDGARAALPRTDAWHEDHAFADLCVACHGGHGDLEDTLLAHADLGAPLAADGSRCDSCHTKEERAFVERYQSVVGRSGPSGTAPPETSLAKNNPPTASRINHGAQGANRSLTAIVLALGALLSSLGIRDLKRRRSITGVAAPSCRDAARWLRQSWSPYAAGVGLGIVVSVSMALFGHRLSGAGAYQHISGYVGRWIAPQSIYWQHIVPTGISWDIWVLLGSVLGAFSAAKLSRQFAIRSIPEGQWTEAFGASRSRRWLIAFAGSSLTEIGAGVAGGCTASLAVSGGAVLAPAAFVFMAGMFVGGIPVALSLYRRTSR